MFGSYEGFEYIASTAPVRGSSTTALPSRPFSAAFAVSCSSLFTVRCTVPLVSTFSNRLPVASSCCCAVRPASTSSNFFSAWVLPKPNV